jgi:hypothetical protein
LELKAEVDQTFKQALDDLSCVMAAEVIGSGISIFVVVVQHVARSCEHQGRPRQSGLARAALRATCAVFLRE